MTEPRSGRVFLSYRREESAGYAGRLFDSLTRQLSHADVFRDLNSIRPGEDFTQVILEAIGASGALITLIGPDWLHITDASGKRRIDQPADVVRLEIEAAFARGVPVFPVLVNAARMPRPEELPESLRRLSRLNAIEITDSHWDYDVARLVTAVELALESARGHTQSTEGGITTQRHQVGVLHAGIAGLADLAESLPPNEMNALQAELRRDLIAALVAHGGTVVDVPEIVGVFGIPQAEEDDPRRTIETASAMLETIERRSKDLPSALSLRVGLSYGWVLWTVVAGSAPPEAMGAALEEAASLRQAAGPGEMLADKTLWSRVRNQYEAQCLELEFRGREHSEAFRILGPRSPVQQRQSPFVGRQEEILLVDLLWSTAIRGDTHVISVVGEPGVGKSRLLAELSPREGALDARIKCHSNQAFAPFLELAVHILGGLPHDVDELRRLAKQFPTLEDESVLLLAALMGLAGAPPIVALADEHQKRQVFAGYWQFLEAACHTRPAFIIVDDLQWADGSSLDLLAFLLERLRNVPMMLILAHRSGFELLETVHILASHTILRVEPLGSEDSLSLGRGYLDVERLPPELSELLLARAEGNPFFTEELLQALLEGGSLSVADGVATLSGVDADIPGTVQAAIQIRLDRLERSARRVIDQAAVFGREFTTDLLAATVGREDLPAALDELERTQLVVAHGPHGWVFKHALIQEVAYSGLMGHERRAMHRKAAEALEAKAGDDPSLLSQVAEHYAKAKVEDKARAYASAAGDVASERLGYVEARALYERALDLWGTGDEEGRLTLLMKLGWASMLGGDIPRALTALIETAAGWRKLGNVRQEGASLATLGRAYVLSGDVDEGSAALREAIELLEPHGPTGEILRAFVWLSTLDLMTSHIHEGISVAKRGLAVADELRLDSARSHLLTTLGSFEVGEGNLSGRQRIGEGLELGERSHEAEALGRAYLNLGLIHSWLGEVDEGQKLCEVGRSAMRKVGAPSYGSIIDAIMASIILEAGRYDEAEALLQQLLGPKQPMLVGPGLILAQVAIAQLMLRQGRYQDCRAVLNEVFPLARRFGGSMFLAPVLTTDAELQEALGNPAVATQSIAEGSELVLASGAATHGLRTLVPAARLLPRDQSRQLLALVRSHAPPHPAFEAHINEADGLISGDSHFFEAAAERYERMGLPYQRARAMLQAGDLATAATILDKLGLDKGPLRSRLRELE